MVGSRSGDNQRWSLDFTEVCLANGRQSRSAHLKDDCTRECPAIEVHFCCPAGVWSPWLEWVAKDATPGTCRWSTTGLNCAVGSPIAGRTTWAEAVLHRSWQADAEESIECFNGRFREECLDQSWFTSLGEARRVIQAWRVDYNLHRPHTSLRMATPAAFAAARPFAKRQRAPAPELCGGSPPEPVAALTLPVLSGTHGFP